MPPAAASSLTQRDRNLILAAAFLGWMFSGIQMTTMTLASGSATAEFLDAGQLQPQGWLAPHQLWNFQRRGEFPIATEKSERDAQLKSHNPRWFARYSSLFLFGAAAGGFLFGWLGDRAGRVKAMAASILCYSLCAGAGYFAVTPEQLLLSRFLSGMGMGGIWPTGVALASEAWSDVSRPKLSGFLGASANFGIMLMSAIAYGCQVRPDSWRWVLIVGAMPAVLGVWVLAFVPESPTWLAARARKRDGQTSPGASSLFHPPLLRLTLIGIALGTIPTLGGWGVTQWFIRWTDAVTPADPSAKAVTAMVRATGGALGSLFGGWLANQFGRRATYFAISLASLLLSEAIYLRLHPSMPIFPWAVFLIGAVSTVFFGWLPLYLPELFPTHARATGAGISFNTGRILSAVGVLGTGWLTAYFNEDYRLAGSVISLVYGLGMVVILFAPDTTGKKLDES